MNKFIWEDLSDPFFEKLRDKYKLEEVVSDGKNDFEKQVLLKDWVFHKLKLGYNNTKKYENALEVLEDTELEFNCSWYVLVYLQCAQALEWYARKLGIDSDHKCGEEEMLHTVCEIWSEELNKWYVIDPMMNMHYMNEQVLNAYEIRKLILEKKDFERVFGNGQKIALPDNLKERYDNPQNYYWFFVYLRNNFVENSNVYDSKVLLWKDGENKDKIWYVGGKNKGEFRKHSMYDGRFIETNDLGEVYPKMKYN